MKQQGTGHATKLSRRTLLRNLGILAGASQFGAAPFVYGADAPAIHSFEEVPPSLSGIVWTHTAGKSAEKFFCQEPAARAALSSTTTTMAGWKST